MKIEFHINAFTPETLPLGRFSEYIELLAKLLGHQNQCHFEEIRDGSAAPTVKISETAIPKVKHRLELVNSASCPAELNKTVSKINHLLYDDNSDGWITVEGENEKIISFPGKNMILPDSTKLLSEAITLQGELYRIGGKDNTIPFGMFNKLTQTDVSGNCEADLAVQLAHFLFKNVRIYGIGHWIIESDGKKILKNYKANSFEPLNDEGFVSTLDKIRKEGGFSGWKNTDNPHQVIMNYRYDTNE